MIHALAHPVMWLWFFCMYMYMCHALGFQMQVTDYYKRAQRNPTNLKLCDVALSAVIQRVTTTLSHPFLANVVVSL